MAIKISADVLLHVKTIEPDLLEQVAKVLKVPVEAIKNFSEAAAINIISSTLHDNAGSKNTIVLLRLIQLING